MFAKTSSFIHLSFGELDEDAIVREDGRIGISISGSRKAAATLKALEGQVIECSDAMLQLEHLDCHPQSISGGKVTPSYCSISGNSWSREFPEKDRWIGAKFKVGKVSMSKGGGCASAPLYLVG